MKPLMNLLFAASLISPNVFAADYRSDYAGEQHRLIKSLSTEDIRQIQAGKGWGLAKAAELNGYPGPRHVLDMAEELELSERQRTEMSDLFDDMKARAIVAGERYLAAEQSLEQAFRSKDVDSRSLKSLISVSADALTELRYVHLATHLAAINLLGRHQLAQYNQLRGYSNEKSFTETDANHHRH